MKFKLTAGHPALGTVVIIMEAADRKDAFSRFKTLVFNFRQWRITRNEPADVPDSMQTNEAECGGAAY
jgi:hypothetical protein